MQRKNRRKTGSNLEGDFPCDALTPLVIDHLFGEISPEMVETFEEMLSTIPSLATFTAELNDTLASALACSLPLRRPPAHLRGKIINIISSIPAIVTTDRQGKIIGFNTAFTALCGYTMAEVRGLRPGDFLQGPLTDPEDAKELGRAVREGIAVTREIINYHKRGTPYRVLVKINPVQDAWGTIVGFTAVENKLGEISLAA